MISFQSVFSVTIMIQKPQSGGLFRKLGSSISTALLLAFSL